jgi:hypothetical protein
LRPRDTQTHSTKEGRNEQFQLNVHCLDFDANLARWADYGCAGAAPKAIFGSLRLRWHPSFVSMDLAQGFVENPMLRRGGRQYGKKQSQAKPNYRRAVLRLPDLDHSKLAVLNSLRSPGSRRVYQYAIEQFIAWYCSEPRLKKCYPAER